MSEQSCSISGLSLLPPTVTTLVSLATRLVVCPALVGSRRKLGGGISAFVTHLEVIDPSMVKLTLPHMKATSAFYTRPSTPLQRTEQYLLMSLTSSKVHSCRRVYKSPEAEEYAQVSGHSWNLGYRVAFGKPSPAKPKAKSGFHSPYHFRDLPPRLPTFHSNFSLQLSTLFGVVFSL